jgi:ribosomal-protein-alanine N-acetyltransferase
VSAALRIELVEAKDLKRLVEVERASFPEPWSEAVLRAELQEAASRRYTKAVLDGVLTGYLGLMFVEDEVHVNTLAVDIAARRCGIATRLLLDGFEAALARGARHATLEVAASNLSAQRLYASFGMAPVGLRRGYYAHGEDALVLWLRELDCEAEQARRAALAESLG